MVTVKDINIAIVFVLDRFRERIRFELSPFDCGLSSSISTASDKQSW